MSTQIFNLTSAIARELNLPERGVAAVVALLAEGSTVPFIARYRKEATGELDEVQIRTIEERASYLKELEDRREAVLTSISEQGKLTDELRARILAVTTKAALEDLYLPFKPKRRTRAMIARERGLEPLSARILEQSLVGDPRAEAAAFVDHERDVIDVDAALSGARDIVAEGISEDADVRAYVREVFATSGLIVSERVAETTQVPTKFEQYYDYREAVSTIPSHRFLAIRRGEREGFLKVEVVVEPEPVIARIEAKLGRNAGSPFAEQLSLACGHAFKRLLAPSVETDMRVDLKLRSDLDAVAVFAANLRNLLLAAPMGTRSVVGIDPGIRTGCKCAAVDLTGRYLDTITIYPGRGDGARAAAELLAFVSKYAPYAIAVGNGTAGRETEAFVRRALKEDPVASKAVVVLVSESGASVYSASDVAREEFPELDLTIRGAISIARRLQDPLAELVKLEPKAIGVGQYQHDVHQPLLVKKLDDVVVSCVNLVGVELNTASPTLLAHVAGIGPSLAKRIVEHRSQEGPFSSRSDLRRVSGLGPKTFEQCAGFIRVQEGSHPLDRSSVHPERYAVVEKMALDLGVELKQLVGNAELIARVPFGDYVTAEVGLATLKDIAAELKKPGRDPRATFEPPKFRDDVLTVADLKPDMILEGVVTNVTNFGAFVDIGVHQDGLVHISQLSDRFVKDANEAVKAGDKLKVKVVSVDLARKRISLTARLAETSKSVADAPGNTADRGPQQGPDRSGPPRNDRGGRPQGGQRSGPPGNDRNGPPRNDRSGPPGNDRSGPPRNDRSGPSPSKSAPDKGGFRHNPFADLLKR